MWWLATAGLVWAGDPCRLPTGKDLPVAVRRVVRRPGRASRQAEARVWWSKHPEASPGVRLQAALALDPAGAGDGLGDLLANWGGEAPAHATCRASWADRLLPEPEAMVWHARAWRALGDAPSAAREEARIVEWVRGRAGTELQFTAADRLLGVHPLTAELARTLVGRSESLRPLWRVLLHEASTSEHLLTPDGRASALSLVDPSSWVGRQAAPGQEGVTDAVFWATWGVAREAPSRDRSEQLLAAVRADWRQSGVQGRAAARATALLAVTAWHQQCVSAPLVRSRERQRAWTQAVDARLTSIQEALGSVTEGTIPAEGRAAALAAELEVLGSCLAAVPDGWSAAALRRRARGRVSELVGRLPLRPAQEPLRVALRAAVAGSWRGTSAGTAREASKWAVAQGEGAALWAHTPTELRFPGAAAAFLDPLLPSLGSLPASDRLAAARRWLPTVRAPAGRRARLAVLDRIVEVATSEPEALERALVAADAGRAGAPAQLGAVLEQLDTDAVREALASLVEFSALEHAERVVELVAPHLPVDWPKAQAVLYWAESGLRMRPSTPARERARGALVTSVIALTATTARADVGSAVQRLDEHLDELRVGSPARRVAAYDRLLEARAAEVGRPRALADLEQEVMPGSPEWCAVAQELQRHAPRAAARERWADEGPRCAYGHAGGETGAVEREEHLTDDVSAFERALGDLGLGSITEVQSALALAAAADGARVLGAGRLPVAERLLAWAEPRLEGAHRLRVRRVRSVALGRQGRWDEAAALVGGPATGDLAVPVAMQRALIALQRGQVRAAGSELQGLLAHPGHQEAAAVNLGIAADQLATRDPEAAVRWLDQALSQMPASSASALLLRTHRHRLRPEGVLPDSAGVQGSARTLHALARLHGQLGRPERGQALVEQALAEAPGDRSRALMLHTRAELAYAAGDLDTAQRGAAEAWTSALAVGDAEAGLWAAHLRADLAAAQGQPASAVLFGKLALQALHRSPYALDCGGCDRPDAVPALAERVVRDLEHQLLGLGRLTEAQALRTQQGAWALGTGSPALPLTDIEAVAADLLLQGHEDVLADLEGVARRPEAAPSALPAGVARLAVHTTEKGGTVQLWGPRGPATVELSAAQVQDLRGLATEVRDLAPDPRPAAQRVYDAVVRPLEGRLEGVHTLQVAATGSAAAVPWAALHDGEHWLASRYVVWGWSQLTLAGSTPMGSSGAQIVGFGASAGGPGLAPLPGAATEVREVADRVFLDEAFTRNALQSVLWTRPRVVHLATHFVLSPSQGLPFVALGDGQRLTVEDLSTFRFHGVELVVLSACNTATVEGSGRLGSVATMIQRQGAEHVVGTLWPVADHTTAAAMQEMYEALAEGLDEGQALQRAQRMLWMGHASGDGVNRGLEAVGGSVPAQGLEGSRHPYYWAPFVVH